MEAAKRLFASSAIIVWCLAVRKLPGSGLRLISLKSLGDQEAPVGRAQPGHLPLLTNGRADASRRSRGLCLFQGDRQEGLVQTLGIRIERHQAVQHVPAQGSAGQVGLLVAGSRAGRRTVASKKNPGEIAWSGGT